MKQLLRFVLFACLLPIHVAAQQLVPATGEFRINQDVPALQYQPNVAVGPDNGYIVVWKATPEGGPSASIYFRRYSSANVALSDEMVVGDGSSDNESRTVKVVYWTDGKYIIAWNTSSNITMRVLDTDNSMGAAVLLGSGDEWDIAVQGNAVAALYGSGTGALNLRSYDLGTNSFTGPAVLVTESATNQYKYPNIRFRADGSLVAIYGRGNYPNIVYRKTFGSDLLAQINETVVYSLNNSLNCIDVSTNVHDELLISTKWGVNGTDVFKAWLLAADGTALIENLGVYSCPYAYFSSECTLFDNGDFVVVVGNRTSLNDPDDYQVRGFYARNYNEQNTGMVVLNTTAPADQDHPAVEKRSDGGFIVVWEGNGFQGDTQGINARAYSGALFPGVIASDNAVVTVDETGTTWPLELLLGTLPTGNVVVDLTVSDATEVTIDRAQLTFTAANWDQPQTVMVTGVDDAIDDGDIALHVTATMNALTADATYAAMGPKTFPVINLDDDATFSLPLAQVFCRSDGMGGVNAIITNQGSPITSVMATSDDQTVVDDMDITVTTVDPTTYGLAITGLGNNVPGTASITLTATDGLFNYTGAFQVNTLGDVAVITQDVDVLTCSTSGTAYQWFLDGSLLPGATQQTYTAAQNGNYSVVVVDTDGCTESSAPYFYGSTRIEHTIAQALWVGMLTETLPLYAPHAGVLQVLDVAGREVARSTMATGLQTIALPGLAPGVYLFVMPGEQTFRRVKP